MFSSVNNLTTQLKVFALALCACSFPALADITIAQVAPFSGPLANTGKAYRAGAQIYFDSINAAGGIQGQKIRFISQDDGYKPEETVRLIQETIQKEHPLAFIGTVGTANVEGILKSKVLTKAETPLIGIRTGARPVLEQLPPYIFSTRASYAAEVQEITKQLWVKRVAVFYQNDHFGQDGLAAAETALKNQGIELVAKGAYERNTTNVEQAVQTIASTAPEAIILLSNTAATAEFIKGIRAKGIAPVLVSLSVTDGPQVSKLIGSTMTHGLTVSQVVPNPHANTPFGMELVAAYNRFPPKDSELNHTVGEGYIAAKVLVEAIRRAGANPTPKKTRDALASIQKYNAYGIPINFSPKNHAGSHFVALTIMDGNGKISPR